MSILSQLKTLFKNGSIDKEIFSSLLRRNGISHGVYTKKRISDEKRKVKRRMSKMSRKANRGSTKGQKVTRGVW